MPNRVRGSFWCLVAATVLVAPSALAGGKPFDAVLSGADVASTSGDPGASGSAHVTMSPGSGVCWELSVWGVTDATAAHLHRGFPGQEGPVMVTFSAPVDGVSSGCGAVDRATIQYMMRHGDEFYVDVHTAAFPGGALRGQLG